MQSVLTLQLLELADDRGSDVVGALALQEVQSQQLFVSSQDATQRSRVRLRPFASAATLEVLLKVVLTQTRLQRRLLLLLLLLLLMSQRVLATPVRIRVILSSTFDADGPVFRGGSLIDVVAAVQSRMLLFLSLLLLVLVMQL